MCLPVSVASHGSRCARAGHKDWLLECSLPHQPQWVHRGLSPPLLDPSSARASALSTKHSDHWSLTTQYRWVLTAFCLFNKQQYNHDQLGSRVYKLEKPAPVLNHSQLTVMTTDLRIWYETTWDTILRCTRKLNTELKICEKKKDGWYVAMLRSIGKQSMEYVQSVLKKKKKATVGRI